MTQFIQLHLLMSYPPANPNRDDAGRPKTAKFGGHERMRISSQCLKRAWRTSDLFAAPLEGHIGTRTRQLGCEIVERLMAKQFTPKEAQQIAEKIAGQFGALEKGGETAQIQQAAHLSPAELEAAFEMADKLARGEDVEDKELRSLVQDQHSAVDIAMFGRMLAARPECNTEAAIQVAHAISVNRVSSEADFFTAVDDLNRPEDSGSAYMGDAYLGAGLFYLYLCIDCDLLQKNLGGDAKLAKLALESLIEATAKVTPNGKQNSTGARAYANYILAERGSAQPRSLSVAFLKPVADEDILTTAIARLEKTAMAMDQVYEGRNEDEFLRDRACLCAHPDDVRGSLAEIKAFAVGVYA